MKLSSQGSTLSDPESDADHDGLLNEEESYWNSDFQNPDSDGDGFMDGEEVASGHDPTIPGPDDILNISVAPQNISKKVGSLVVAGLYEGSLKPNSPLYNESVEGITEEIITQYSINARDTMPTQYLIIASTPESEKAYLNEMDVILKALQSAIPKNFENLLKAASTTTEQDASEYFSFLLSETKNLEALIRQLVGVSVPTTWDKRHANLINTIKNIRKNYDLLRIADQDPYQGMVAFSALAHLTFQEFPETLKPYKNIR